MGVVPFRMSDVAPRFVPAMPWMSAFPELNIRTYVSLQGKPGVWFFSLDATNPVAVRVARLAFHLPYMDANITIRQDESGWYTTNANALIEVNRRLSSLVSIVRWVNPFMLNPVRWSIG